VVAMTIALSTSFANAAEVPPGGQAPSLAPHLYHCQPVTAANEVEPPPPLWQVEGKSPPPAELTEQQELPTAPCPAGEIAYPEPLVGTPPHMAAGTERDGSAPGGRLASASPFAQPFPERPPAGGNPNYHYAGSGTEFKIAGGEAETKSPVGGAVEMAIGDPEINIGGSHSLAEIAFSSGPENLRTIELGWDVDPGLFGDALPHLFVFVNNDGYEEGGDDCYECHFVPIEGAPFAPGQSLDPEVTGPSNTYPFGVEFIDGNWWVWFDFEWIGYLEGGFWNHEFTSPPEHEEWGEVYDNHGDTTDMGNGLFGSNEKALLMRHPILYPAHNTSVEEEIGKPYDPQPELYSVGNVSPDRRSWRFGGSGTGKVVPVPEVDAGASPAPQASGETVNGSVDPDGQATTYHFEYGTTTSYGSSTSTASAGSGWVPVPVSSELTGLASSTTYHYRVVATNEAGTTDGPDGTFKTLPEWSVMTTQNPGSTYGKGTHLSGVSCSSSTSCIAVGGYGNASSTVPVAVKLTGSTWSVQEAPPSSPATGSLGAVSCPSTSWCMAVGSKGSTGEPLAESWNGTSWSVMSPPEPSDRWTSSPPAPVGLVSVACTSSEWCMALGQYRKSYTTGLGEWGFVDTWNGKAWSVQSLPAPPESTTKLLPADISCVSTSSCTVVGRFYEGSEAWMPLAEHWNGSAWTGEEAPPTWQKTSAGELESVSCFSTSFCAAPGAASLPADRGDLLADLWNGTGWSEGALPEPKKGGLFALRDVSCFSSTECVSVGYRNETTSSLPAAEALSGSNWIAEEPPVPTASKPAVTLAGVSCVSGPVCVAVGQSHLESGEQVSLAEIYK
jgi:hypothetical protein